MRLVFKHLRDVTHLLMKKYFQIYKALNRESTRNYRYPKYVTQCKVFQK